MDNVRERDKENEKEKENKSRQRERYSHVGPNSEALPLVESSEPSPSSSGHQLKKLR